MKHFLLVLSLLLCAACSVFRQVAPEEHSRVEVHTKTVIEKDTVYIQLPAIVQERQTLDTISVLENKYAKSVAEVSGGTLSHSLQTKPVSEPVIMDKQIVYRDSLVFVDRAQTVEVEKSLTGWQSFKLKLGGWAFAGLILLIVIAILYFVKPFKINVLL